MKGVSVDSDIIQYRGIKYGSIPARWQDALIHPLDTSASYTEFGPIAPQLPGSINIELNLLQVPPSKVPFPTSLPANDEFDCLNLNIMAPTNAASKLPVLVWIHGGGFFIGSGSWPQRDATKLVRRSIDMGKPTVVVTINYRLSALGMLAGGSGEFKGSYGLRDQQVALRWVQEYISVFGGDPARVTIMGESAGAASVHSHILHTDSPLFSRAVMMGGTLAMIGEHPASAQAKVYEAIVAAVGGKDNLYTLSADELIAKIPPTLPWSPTPPEGVAPVTSSTARAAPPWLEAVVVGYCKYDGSIIQTAYAGRPDPATQFVDSVEKLLPASSAAAVLARYGLSRTTPKEEAIPKLIQFSSDTGFGLGAKQTLTGFGGKGYYYVFQQGNPFPGPLQSRASHIMDEMFLWGAMDPLLSDADVEFGKKWAASLLNFVSGAEPWSSVSTGRMMNFGPEGKVEETGFPNDIKELEDIGFGSLWDVWRDFMEQDSR